MSSQQVPVATKVAGAGVAGFAGNVIVGGLVGMGVDAATGSTLEHFPNPVFASLVPDRSLPARVQPNVTADRKPRARAFKPEPSSVYDW